MANFGRYGDDTVAHVETGELIVPRALIENNPKLKESIFSHLRELGVEDPERYVVGTSKNSLNPDTGLPEFFLKKLFKGAKKAVSSVAKGVGRALKGVGKALKRVAHCYSAFGSKLFLTGPRSSILRGIRCWYYNTTARWRRKRCTKVSFCWRRHWCSNSWFCWAKQGRIRFWTKHSD